LIILSCALGIGATETFKKLIEQVSGLKAGLDFHLAYSPVPFPDEQNLETLKGYKRIVAAVDKNSLELASSFLQAVTPAGLFKTYDLKAAEAAVIFTSVCRHAEAALAHEFSLLCERAGLDYFTIYKIMSLFSSYEHFKPTVSYEDQLGLLFIEEAENLNVKLRIASAALNVNGESYKHVVKLVRESLRKCGKSIRRAKIVILGGSQTPNVADVPKTSLEKLTNVLASRGAKIKIYDPHLSSKATADFSHMSLERSFKKALEGIDCIIVLTGHEQFRRLNLNKIKLLARMPAAIVDLEGIIEPQKAEAAGFVYRGLGRGVWTR
ncbi:hypothetical protein H5T51_07560, partial [Candidatus Bathyarchaeota archaeon]|nr:hypothetical protein [Candidatus Bathyarchaeota archaeon]